MTWSELVYRLTMVASAVATPIFGEVANVIYVDGEKVNMVKEMLEKEDASNQTILFWGVKPVGRESLAEMRMKL